MNFDLTTFILEIINFLVLLWLLQRLLYKPTLNAIQKRQETIEKKVADAHLALDQAHQLEEQYGQRLVEWQKEKRELEASLRDELEEERQRQLANVRKEIEQEKVRAQALSEARQKEEVLRCERLAVEQAAQYLSGVLGRFASDDLERRICKLFLDDLSAYDRDKLSLTMNHGGADEVKVQVATAYPLADDLREAINTGLKSKLGQQCQVEFSQDQSLIAGIRVTTAGGILQANLQDAVRFFRGIESNGSSK